MQETEVIVAGAGPVGSVGAARLAAMGIDVIVCEAEATCAHDLRASTFHAATLEMLDEIDAAQPLIERGLKASVYQMRDRRTGEYLEFDLVELADRTRFPFRLQCEQHHMSTLLTERLPDMPNADVQFNTRVVAVEQDADGVTVTVETGGERRQLRTKFLIGADGAHSTVRKQIGVGFDGFTYDEKFLSLSTSFPIETVITDLAHVNYISDPDEWLVLLRVPALWRILVPADVDDSDELLTSDTRAAEVFERIVPGHHVETSHRTIYRVHQRVAESFARGRVMLIGDAAHLNNPLGGFGMNSGIHDAWNLADKLWKILRKGGDASLIDLFDRQRRHATREFIQAQTIANKAFIEQGPGESHRSRLDRMAAIHADPVRRRQYLLRQAMFESLEDAEKVQ
ncbi:FAD-dependent monooxygenase [Altererythrobacter sp. C41]|uniref:FAD-dependent monooxygenase n=1 Tax=Altererythrobacter sp. C41 TaxID=2806021 RepID=UPI0019324EEE|nr:FAD-dependent monooxygenase [Altererythrobacter sp. C41]